MAAELHLGGGAVAGDSGVAACHGADAAVLPEGTAAGDGPGEAMAWLKSTLRASEPAAGLSPPRFAARAPSPADDEASSNKGRACAVATVASTVATVDWNFFGQRPEVCEASGAGRAAGGSEGSEASRIDGGGRTGIGNAGGVAASGGGRPTEKLVNRWLDAVGSVRNGMLQVGPSRFPPPGRCRWVAEARPLL